MKGLNNLLMVSQKNSNKTKVGVNFTITGINILDLDNLVDFAHEIGVNYLNIGLITYEGNAFKNYAEFDYIPGEMLEHMEKLLASNSKYSDIKVTVDVRPSFIEYINLKYGCKIPLTKFGTRCKSTGLMLYMKANGEVHPCRQCDTDGVQKGELAKILQVNNFNIKMHELTDIIRSDYFGATYRFTQSQDTFKRPNICSFCKHKFDCSPCPILLYQNKTEVSECEWANHELALLKNRIISSRFTISKTLLYAVK